MQALPVVAGCPTCHQPVAPTDYYCANCGQNLRPTPPSTSLGSQVELYLKSILLPPLGIIWSLKYLKQKELKAKLVGLTMIIITVVELGLIAKTTINLINTVNEQVNSQLNQMMF